MLARLAAAFFLSRRRTSEHGRLSSREQVDYVRFVGDARCSEAEGKDIEEGVF
jgi:hypothetical protein